MLLKGVHGTRILHVYTNSSRMEKIGIKDEWKNKQIENYISEYFLLVVLIFFSIGQLAAVGVAPIWR